MPIYRIMVEGNGCLVEIDGTMKRLGFYATRFIKAPDETVACARAMDSVRADLGPWLRNPPEFSPVLAIHSIDEAGRVRSSPGFVWYPDEEGSH